MNSEHTIDTDRPIPVAFWGNVGEVVKADHIATDTVQWAPSFAALGVDIHDALPRYTGTFSALLSKQILTIDDVYRHLQAVQSGGQVTDTIADQEPDKPEKPISNQRAFRAAHKQVLQTAADEWHKACGQRKEAMRQWDDYVKSKKKYLEDLRGK